MLLLATTAVKAQHIKTISGRAVNMNDQPLSVNVVVLSAADSAFIRGASFIDTAIRLTNINRPEVLLRISSLSFADTVIRVVYNGQPDIDLGNIVMRLAKKDVDGTVTVVGKLPLVKYNTNGTLEVNVANTILSASSSVTEILSKSPNVIDNNGQLSVFGKGDALIYLNGKQITAERLSSIPVSRIVKIEIISNPSAKYDAEGKAVINIITKTKAEEGIMGTATQHVTYSDFAGTNTQSFLDLSYVNGKFSVVGNYSLLLGKNREFLQTTRTRPVISEYLKSDLETDWRRKYNNFSNYGLGVQYNASSRSSISLAYSGYLENLGGYIGSNNAITTNTDNSFYASRVDKDEVKHNNSLTLNYNRTVDSLGSTFFIGTQYSHYNLGLNDFITENRTVNGVDGYRQLKNNMNNDIYVSSTQSDFAKIFRNNKKLEMGAKFSYVNAGSATEFYIAENGGGFTLDNNLSNNFKYIEKVPAAYMTYSGAINKISFGIGVRGEWTNYELNTSVNGGQVLTDSYFNIFPNLQLNTAVSKEVRMRFSYASRITRPRYQALNPFVIYQDPFTTIEGNPNLIPEKTHAFEIGANYRKYDFRVGYNYAVDPIDAAALRGTSPNSYVLKAINLKEGHSYFASVARTVSLKWWSSVNTVNISYSKLVDNKYDFDFIKPAPQIYLYSSNTFNVKDLFRVQLLAWYWGRKKYGLYDDYSRYLLTLGVEKDFLKNKLKLRLVANDIFRRTNSSGIYGVGRTEIFYDRTFNNGYFRFTATWNFGKLKKSSYRIRSTGQTENNRVN